MADTISRQELRQGNLDWDRFYSAIDTVSRGQTDKDESNQFQDIMANLTNLADEDIKKSSPLDLILNIASSGAGPVGKLASYTLQGLLKKQRTKGAPKVFDEYIAGLSGEKKEIAEGVRAQYKDAVNKGVLNKVATSVILDQIMPWKNEALEGLGFKEKFKKLDPFAKMKEKVFNPTLSGEVPLADPGRYLPSGVQDKDGLFDFWAEDKSIGEQLIPPSQVEGIGTRMVDDPSKGLKNLLPTGVDQAEFEKYISGKTGKDFELGEWGKMLPILSLLLRGGLK